MSACFLLLSLRTRSAGAMDQSTQTNITWSHGRHPTCHDGSTPCLMNHNPTSHLPGIYLNIMIHQLTYIMKVVNTTHLLHIDFFSRRAPHQGTAGKTSDFMTADQHPEDLANPAPPIIVVLSPFSRHRSRTPRTTLTRCRHHCHYLPLGHRR